MRGRVLVIAGSDSGGGAGIQADIKTITALGGFAATAVTALTAQNTEAVFEVIATPPAFVRRQMDAVLSDIGADCLKTGMLANAGIIEAVGDGLPEGVPLVVDPVMVASSGARLLDERAVEALKRLLIAQARVVTPNAPEAEALTGIALASLEDMRRAADVLLRLGARAVVVKGGHMRGDTVRDLIVDDGASLVLEAPRIATRATHGTGCTLASAIATGLAQGMAFRQSVERAHAYLQKAIATAPVIGRGHGPVNHAHTMKD
jgi:hydroxymethylpyrimidine/phosphomethylpyrimidine kinase